MRKFINNKCMRLILPNVVIVLTCMIITLCVLDYYNPLMGFLSRGMSLGVIAIWILSLLLYLGATCIRVFLYRKR